MPIVHVYVFKDFSNEAKKKVIAGTTKVFTEMGIPAEAVEVVESPYNLLVTRDFNDLRVLFARVTVTKHDISRW